MNDKRINDLKEILKSNDDFIGIYQIAKCRTETNIMQEFFRNRKHSKCLIIINWSLCGLSIVGNILGMALNNDILRCIGLISTFVLMIFALYVCIVNYVEMDLLNAMKKADDKDEITKLLSEYMTKHKEEK